jgi:acyl-CoA synthetase (AMP-forming)/AMP-acid ligase II
MDVTTAMRRAAAFFADREAVVHGNDRLTFAQTWERGCRLANGLIGLGLKPGDRVAVLEGNSKEAADFFLGAGIANLVRVPLYPRNSADAHLHMVEHTGCRALIVAGNHADEVADFKRRLPSLEHLMVRDQSYECWLAAQSPIDPMLKISPEDNYIIRHTGGTIGRSKGVAFTHRAWLACGRDWFYNYPPVEPGDRCLHLGPISHGSGYLFVPIWVWGGCNVMLDRFEASAAVEIMERERIGYLFAVPTMVNAMNHEPTVRGRDWSKLKCMLIAAAPISEATALTAREIFGESCLHQGYGQTEALLLSFMGPRQWFTQVEGSNPLRSCGLVMPWADLEIWDEQNRPLPLGQPGQIVARVDGQMTGFWNDPEGTRERMVDGWVLTGDIGMIDKNGYLYLLDRAADMIISGGFNIWPTELENAIATHPAVMEVAVFGIPDPRWGETPCAVVVPKSGRTIDVAEVVQLCAEQLGSYKKPGRVVVRDEPLPKTPVGKIKRRQLREPFWIGHTRRVAGS